MRSIEELKRAAQRVAAELTEATRATLPEGKGQQQGSAHRKLPETLRRSFIEVRSELFDRGIYDPILARFDSATSTQESTLKIAEQLASVAEGLG